MKGGCICGSVRYEVTENPITLYACHCTDCQTVSGSGFVLGMRVPVSSIKITKGAPVAYVRSRADGRKKNIFRCPDCLTALWSSHLEPSDYEMIYAGTLDNSSSLQPIGHIWTRSAQPWVTIPENVLSYETQPENMDAIVQAWKDRE